MPRTEFKKENTSIVEMYSNPISVPDPEPAEEIFPKSDHKEKEDPKANAIATRLASLYNMLVNVTQKYRPDHFIFSSSEAPSITKNIAQYKKEPVNLLSQRGFFSKSEKIKWYVFTIRHI